MNFVSTSDISTMELSSDQCSVAFFAFPFVALQPLKSPKEFLEEEPVGASHPVRSLHQFQYSFESTRKQNERQIVLGTGESTNVLHVPQAWMLLINGGKFSMNDRGN